MLIANIKEFRTELHAALADAGFVLTRNGKYAPDRWDLPGQEVVPAYFADVFRKWWGFTLSGAIGFDLIELRTWLNARFKREELGIFKLGFVSMHVANYRDIGDSRATLDEDVPMAGWVDRIRQKLREIPSTLDEVVDAYRHRPETLMRLGDDFNKPAWDFLLDWYPDRDTTRTIPQSLFGPRQ
jgi:hypothetical protein